MAARAESANFKKLKIACYVCMCGCLGLGLGLGLFVFVQLGPPLTEETVE